MSGHSKWSTIKRQKGVNDAKRGQIFTKLANAISVAVREGGGPDPTSNFKLRLAVEKARTVNMPRDNVERAIDRGAGKGGGAILESVTYEGFGPLGTAIIVQAVTDNKNRTSPLVKSTIDKHGGTMGVPGSVAWQFESRGVITVLLNGQSEDEVMLQVIDAGADDIESSDGILEVYTKPEDLNTVKDQLVALGLTVESAEVILKPKTPVQITTEEDVQKVMNFLEHLEDLDDVTEVFSNADITV